MLIYKYFRPDRIDVLENGLIRFTQAVALNDPFETYPCLKLLEESLMRRQQAAVDSFRDCADIHTLVAASYLAKKRVRDSLPELIEEISSELAILSLTKERNNLLMWSHYADSHRGFVIGFDSEHPFFKGQNADLIIPLREVNYSTKRTIMPPFGVILPTRDLVDIFLYTKSNHWAYEDELRMVAHRSIADKVGKDARGYDVYLYKLPSDCVKEIIFGKSMLLPLREKIKALVEYQYLHAELFEACLSEIEFNLDIVPFHNRS